MSKAVVHPAATTPQFYNPDDDVTGKIKAASDYRTKPILLGHALEMVREVGV